MQLHNYGIFNVFKNLAQKCSDFKPNKVFFHQKHSAQWRPKLNWVMGVKRKEGDKYFSPSAFQVRKDGWSGGKRERETVDESHNKISLMNWVEKIG